MNPSRDLFTALVIDANVIKVPSITTRGFFAAAKHRRRSSWGRTMRPTATPMKASTRMTAKLLDSCLAEAAPCIFIIACEESNYSASDHGHSTTHSAAACSGEPVFAATWRFLSSSVVSSSPPANRLATLGRWRGSGPFGLDQMFLLMRLATRCWRDSSQPELALQVVVLCGGSLTVETRFVFYCWLGVLVGGEDLRHPG